MEQEEVGVGRERTEEREESRHQHQVGASAISSWGGRVVPFQGICMGMHNFWKAKEGTFERSILNH